MTAPMVPSFGTFTIIVYYLNWLSNLRHQTVCLAVGNITYFQGGMESGRKDNIHGISL